jgi:hypothetical protein
MNFTALSLLLRRLGGVTTAGCAAVNLAADTDYSTGNTPRAVRVGTTAGAVKIDDLDGTTTTIPNVLAGETIHVGIKKIYSTANGTTAAGLTVFY